MTCARTLRLQNGEPGRGVCSSLSLCFCLLFVLTLGLANQIAQFPSHICESNPLLGNTSCKVKDLTCKVCNADRTKKSSFDLTCNVTDSLRYFVKFRITNLSTSLAAKKRRKMDSAKVSGADCAPRHLVIHGFPKCSTIFRPHFSLFQHPLKGIQTAHLRSSSAGFGAGQGWAKAALTPLQSCKPRSSIQSKQS